MHLYNDKKQLLFDSCILSQSIWSHKNKAAPCNRLIMELGLSSPLTLQSCFHNEAFGILAQNLLWTIKFWAWFNMKIWGHHGFWKLPIWSCNFLPALCWEKRGCCDSSLLLVGQEAWPRCCVLILSTSPSSLPCCWLLSSLTEITHAGIFRNIKIFIKSALITASQNYLPSLLSLKTSLLNWVFCISRTLFSTSGGTANAAVKKTNLPAFSFLEKKHSSLF